jgi:hypothetical protein
MLIDRIFTNSNDLKELAQGIYLSFKFNWVFIRELAKLTYKRVTEKYNSMVIGFIYLILYLFHWVFVTSDHIFVSVMIHIVLALSGVNLFLFLR